MNELVIGATGHRVLTHNIVEIKEELKKIFIQEQPNKVISGFALGYDILFIEVALELGIPFIAAIPFVEQAVKWPEKERQQYLYLLSKAKDIYISPETKTGNKIYTGYFERNLWICKNSDMIVAYFNPNIKNGGTFYTVNQALKSNKKVINIYNQIENNK